MRFGDGTSFQFEAQSSFGFPFSIGRRYQNLSIPLNVFSNDSTQSIDIHAATFKVPVPHPISLISTFLMRSKDCHFSLKNISPITIKLTQFLLPQHMTRFLPQKVDALTLKLRFEEAYRVQLWGENKKMMCHLNDSEVRTIYVENGHFSWGQFYSDISGEIREEAQKNMFSFFQIEAAGLPTFLRQLGRSGVLDPRVAVVAAEGVSFYSPTATSKSKLQGRDFINLPLVFQNKQVFLGPLRIYDFEKPILKGL